MITKTEEALKILVDTYAAYADDRRENKIYPPQDLLKRLTEDEKDKFRALLCEFNSKRLQKSEDAVRIAAADFVKFFNEHGL